MFDVRSFRDKMYDAIKLDILSGNLKQGERISAVDLAERFQVSPQPVREALIRLAEEGLVYVRPRYGTFVTTVSRQRIVEMNEAREMIEVYALSHARTPLVPAAIKLIEEANDKMTEVLSRDHFAYLDYNHWDFQFHLGTTMLAANATMTNMYRKLHPHYLYAMVMYRYATTILGDHQDHVNIVLNLRSGHAADAANVAAAHVQHSTRRLLELMDRGRADEAQREAAESSRSDA